MGSYKLEIIKQSTPDELPVTKTPEFLKTLAEDNVELAKIIEARIPGWKINIEAVTGNPDLAQNVLSHIKYVSKREILAYIGSVSDEAQECIDRGEKVVFLGFDKSVTKSNYFFYKQMVREKPKLAASIDYVTNHEIEGQLEAAGDKKVNVFVLDDCSMSGSQMYGNLLWWVRPCLNGGMPLENVKGKEIDLKVRIIGAGVKALEKQEQFETMVKHAENPANNISMDIKTEKVPDVVDVVGEMGLVTPEHTVLFDFDQRVLWANHGMNAGTLVLFAHKIPDNTSAMLIEGNFSNQLGITPLLDKETEKLFRYENFE